MGKQFDNEVELRKHAKEARSLILEQHDIDRAVQMISEHEEILSYDFGKTKYLSLLPTVRYEKGLKNKYLYLRKLIEAGFRIYESKCEYDELVFFAAAKSDLQILRSCMEKISKDNYNKTKEGNTVLVFFIKYGDLENPNYLETIKMLVNEYRIDVNKADYKNHSPIIILLSKFASLQKKNMSQYNDTILNSISIILNRNNVDLDSHTINNMTAHDIIESLQLKNVLELLKKHNQISLRQQSDKTDSRDILFTLISEKKEEEFLKKINEIVFEEENPYDIEDGNNSLLQLACEKNLNKVVNYLLKNGANPIKVTKRNKKPPLEIAARRNYYSIFRCILDEHKVVIDEDLFKTFLVNRGRQIKTKYFDEILCYDGLRLDITYQNGNTPLHYAIIFSNTEAILKQLKRGASLWIKNKHGKTPLDYISREDLELYMDQCILYDNHNRVHSSNYELGFDFSGFVTRGDNLEIVSEAEVPCKICSSDRLKSLAKHPLMMTYIEIKWNSVSSFYNKILMLYGFFFAYSLIMSIYLGHVTFLYLILICLLMYCTFQPTMQISTEIENDNIVSCVLLTVFTSLAYYLFRNVNACISFFVLTLFYQFLQQHVNFSKYQALLVSSFRKVTPYLLSLFALQYLSNVENNRKNFQLNLIIFLIIGYIIVVTHSFNALADSVSDIGYSFKTIYNKNVLRFITFYEIIHSIFSSYLEDPFLYKTFENKKGKRSRLNFYLNKNKFVNEKFHFCKLDVLTVKKLQDLAIRRNQQ